jgi:hypothetical protein
MLCVFDTAEAGAFAVFAAAREETVELHATSGDRLWYSDDILALQIAKGKDGLQSKLLCALNKRDDDPRGFKRSQFSVQLVIDSAGNLELTVKEQIGNTSAMSRLYRGTIPQSYGTGAGLMTLLRCVSSRMSEDADAIKRRDQSLCEYSSQLQVSTEQYKVLVGEKDKFQDGVVRNMCMLLNAKKRHTGGAGGDIEVMEVDYSDDFGEADSQRDAHEVFEVESDVGEGMDSMDGVDGMDGVEGMDVNDGLSSPESKRMRTESGSFKRANTGGSDAVVPSSASSTAPAPPAPAPAPTPKPTPTPAAQSRSQMFLNEADSDCDSDQNALDFM